MANNCKRSGIAVISFDLLSVFSWPTTRPPWSEHHAESIGKGEDAVARSKETLRVLPSSETSVPLVSCATACVQDKKHAWKRCGLRRAKTRLKVSWEGIPCGKAKKVWSQARLLLPKSSISWKPSPPVKSVHKAMTRISRRLCFFVRSMRGSSKVRKCSTIDAFTVSAMGDAPLHRDPVGSSIA